MALVQVVSVDIPPAVEHVAKPGRTPVGGGSGRPAIVVALAIVALIGAAVLKPWGGPEAAGAVPAIEPSQADPTATDDRRAVASTRTSGRTALLTDPDGAAVQGGLLVPGTYTDVDVDGLGVNVRFTVPSGWSWDGSSLVTGERGEDALVTFFTGDVRILPDPCHWLGRSLPPPTGADVTALMSALAGQPMRDATRPVARRAASLRLPERWPGTAITLRVPDDLEGAGCDENQFRGWVLEPERFLQTPRLSLWWHGQRDYVWAIRIEGVRLIVDAITMGATPSHVMSDVDAILRSIVVGHWG